MNHRISFFTLLLLLFTFSSLTILGQSKILLKQIDTTKLPKGIQYEGKIKTAVRWTDSLGDNVVLLTETGFYRNKKFKHENDGTDAELFAYHFLIKNNNTAETWKVHDFISDCNVDLEASFIENSFQATDLNNDGFAEVWLMYKTVCHGDVSPGDMKIIMYQGQQKFAIRGRYKVFEGTDNKGKKRYDGGEYKFDQAFANGPKLFLQFAKQLWEKNIKQ